MSIGTRLRTLRRHYKLTQQQLAEICEVSKGGVSQWENDQTGIALERLLALHARHPFSFDWLLTGFGPPPGAAESQLLAIYSTLDERGQSHVLKVAELEADYRTPKTHVLCPDCQGVVPKNARACMHCGCRLKPIE